MNTKTIEDESPSQGFRGSRWYYYGPTVCGFALIGYHVYILYPHKGSLIKDVSLALIALQFLFISVAPVDIRGRLSWLASIFWVTLTFVALHRGLQ